MFYSGVKFFSSPLILSRWTAKKTQMESQEKLFYGEFDKGGLSMGIHVWVYKPRYVYKRGFYANSVVWRKKC